MKKKTTRKDRISIETKDGTLVVFEGSLSALGGIIDALSMGARIVEVKRPKP